MSALLGAARCFAPSPRRPAARPRGPAPRRAAGEEEEDGGKFDVGFNSPNPSAMPIAEASWNADAASAYTRASPIPDGARLRAHLLAHGYVVVAGAADEAQLGELRSLFWDHLEEASTMRRGRPETWGGAFPGPAHLGLLTWGHAGQCEAMWRARCLPAVGAAFEAAWGVEAASAVHAEAFSDCVLVLTGLFLIGLGLVGEIASPISPLVLICLLRWPHRLPQIVSGCS